MAKTQTIDPNNAATMPVEGQAQNPAAPGVGAEAQVQIPPQEQQLSPEAQAQADMNHQVQDAAKTLRGGFGNGAEYKQNAIVRRIVNTLFADELKGLDLSGTDQSVDSVFQTVTEDMANNADEMGAEMGRQIAAHIKAIGLVATRQVTLKRGIVAIDMAKAYVNFRPGAKLVNSTFFNAVE